MRSPDNDYKRQVPRTENLSVEEILGMLEKNDENENIIERTRKREELLELLDLVEETD